MLGALALLLLFASDAGVGSCVGATGVSVTFKDFATGLRRLDEVKVGWTARRLREHLGAPESCEGDVWRWSAGKRHGPLVTVSVTVKDGAVTKLERSGVGCVLEEVER